MKQEKKTYNEIVFTENQEQDIVESYMNHISSVKIGEKYGVSHKIILKVLHRHNVPVSQKQTVRRYSLNEEYFDHIDSQEKAYILGLLYADGSNNPEKGTISISLQESDKLILEDVRKNVGSNKPLEYLDYSKKKDGGYSYKNQYRLLMFSKHMCDSLSDIGMVKNKSLVLSFPNIPDELYPHFIRGYYDGDGSVCQQIKSSTNHAVLITITSTESFCKSLVEICKNELGFSPKIYDASCRNGVTKVCTISGRRICKKFLDWIYKDATIYLERKYQRYVNYYLDDSLGA